VLGNLSDIVQLVGFPIALIAIFLAYREGRNSRDLQAALTLTESFRGSWEKSWRKALDKLEDLAEKGREPVGDLREDIFDMLNWLDGVGCLIEADMLARPHRVLATINPQLIRAIRVTAPILQADELVQAPGYWHGVRTLERALSA
jgi:hypothetical protein